MLTPFDLHPKYLNSSPTATKVCMPELRLTMPMEIYSWLSMTSLLLSDLLQITGNFTGFSSTSSKRLLPRAIYTVTTKVTNLMIPVVECHPQQIQGYKVFVLPESCNQTTYEPMICHLQYNLPVAHSYEEPLIINQ